MPGVVLYTQSVNPFSEKVALALAIKGVEYELVVSNDPADLRRWSPITRQLPVLEIDGKQVHDSSEILRWLDEIYPTPLLVSPDPKVAEAQQRLASWSDTSFLWYWDRWRTARFPRPGDEQPVNPSLLGKLRSGLERATGRPPQQLSRVQLREAEVVSEMIHRLDDLVGFLGTRRFFHADEPSVADLSIYAMMRVVIDGPMPAGREVLDERPALSAYMKRMQAIVGDSPTWGVPS